MTIAAPSAETKEQQTGSPLEVLLIFLRLGVSCFGGPIAHIGYFRDEFVVRRRWIGEQAYADFTHSFCRRDFYDEVKVELIGVGDHLELRVSDSGIGFDPESAKGKGGLGFLSMSERLRLIGGDLSVESAPSYGTRIRVRVPLPATNIFR